VFESDLFTYDTEYELKEDEEELSVEISRIT